LRKALGIPNLENFARWVDIELLAAKVEQETLQKARHKLGIDASDIVIGSFNRVEKFSRDFFSDVAKIIDHFENVKIILAGPGDKERVLEYRAKLQVAKNLIILDNSDTDILGWITDIYLDSYPNPGGFSVLEVMAKGVPALTKDQYGLTAYGDDRDKDLFFSNSEQLIKLICELTSSKNEYEKFSTRSKDIIKSMNRTEQDKFLQKMRELTA